MVLSSPTASRAAGVTIGYSLQQFGLHGGASEGGQPLAMGKLPFFTRPAELLISLSSFGEPQSGHSGLSTLRTSSSNSDSHLLQEYSKIGMLGSLRRG